MSNDYWVEDSDAIYLSKDLYQKLSDLAAKKNGGYTGQGIIDDLVEEIIQDYVNRNQVRFLIYKQEFEGAYSYSTGYIVMPAKPEDKYDDFVGVYFDLVSKENLLQIAKNGYGISEDEIEFLN